MPYIKKRVALVRGKMAVEDISVIPLIDNTVQEHLHRTSSLGLTYTREHARPLGFADASVTDERQLLAVGSFHQ